LARKILLADDSVTAQNMGRKILADAGYEVITVNNGSAALKKIAEQKPDLIVLDVYMPGYSGLEVCQRLKEAQETSRVPVLLTVGKLEPFKPEESKRVRADGFIVKPFEASELLSALSKLEDKIVPRAEASKPGRFARATAALEEGRYDKSVASIDEDSGWKNRIAFPPKKKEKAASKESNEPVDFESTHRDLRGLIEHKLADKAHANKSEENRVDLGALAPEGLPKDVTPEEIAALAAAAAQVKGKIAENKFSSETTGEEHGPAQTVASPEVSTPSSALSEDKSVEKIQASQQQPSEAASMAAASPSEEITATIGGPEVATSPGSGNGFSSHRAVEQTVDEPVTMASAGSDGSRWTAVSVGLDPDEAALSLEQEMQKAYAVFAAAETGHSASDTLASETAVRSPEVAGTTEFSTPSDAAPSEPAQSIPAMLAPEVAQSLSAVAEASTAAIRAAAQELESVAQSYIQETSAGHGATPAAEAPAQPAPEAPQTVEAIAKDSSTPATGELPAEVDAKRDESASLPETKTQDWKNEAPKNEESFATAIERTGDSIQTTADRPEGAASTLVNEVPPERTSSSQVSSEQISSEMTGAIADSAIGEDSGQMASKDSDAAETTAAAWASWRRIRESGDSKTPSEKTSDVDDASTPPDTAARAVAAGAEKTPEEVSAEAGSDPEAIASIVDSVLADLRPKIFEEISRKMGKKK
jgi:CheY-like chemotaxis protein